MTMADDRQNPDPIELMLAELRDVMPTLLDLAGVPIPDSCDGQSLAGDTQRTNLYGEIGEGAGCSRMMRDKRFKLIYYPAGNRSQLFDIENDRRESTDLAQAPGAS